MSDEFFVGYLGAPPQTARRMKRVAVSLLVLAAAVATALAIATGPFDRATFDYGTETEWRGTIELSPLPVLIANKPGASDGPFSTLERFPLVAQGKHGAEPSLAGLDGAAVRLKATRIARQGTTMLELVPGSIERDERAVPGDGRPAPASQIQDLGRSTFSGEIVDSKCFLGVMNPGRLEVHRACALRCIAGGIPPMLFAHDAEGREAHLLLVDANGQPLNDRVLGSVATPVTIDGRLERRDDLYYLYATTWRRK
jgi:hypothetical protein